MYLDFNAPISVQGKIGKHTSGQLSCGRLSITLGIFSNVVRTTLLTILKSSRIT